MHMSIINENRILLRRVVVSSQAGDISCMRRGTRGRLESGSLSPDVKVIRSTMLDPVMRLKMLSVYSSFSIATIRELGPRTVHRSNFLPVRSIRGGDRSEEHTSELQSPDH